MRKGEKLESLTYRLLNEFRILDCVMCVVVVHRAVSWEWMLTGKIIAESVLKFVFAVLLHIFAFCFLSESVLPEIMECN